MADAIRVGLDRFVLDAMGSEALEERVQPSDGEGARSAVTVLELTLLKDQVSGERTGRSRCRGPLTVCDDGVRDVQAVSWLGVSVEHFLAQFVSHGICDSACVDEETLVRQVGQ